MSLERGFTVYGKKRGQRLNRAESDTIYANSQTFPDSFTASFALGVLIPGLRAFSVSFHVRDCITRKSVHRTRMPPPNAIQKKGLFVTVTGIP